MYRGYFSQVLKSKGVPHLSANQLRRLLSIGSLEYHIDELVKMNMHSRSIYNKLEKEKSKLNRLTKGLQPEELLKEMVELSR